MNWYVVHTRPRQEHRVLQNLLQQGFECYFPTLNIARLQEMAEEGRQPLFPRYLFVRLDIAVCCGGWESIRSTKGVSRLVMLGSEPAKVDDDFIRVLRSQEAATLQQCFLNYNDSLHFAGESFSEFENVCQAIAKLADGASRVIVLIELLTRPINLSVSFGKLQKSI